MWVNLSQLSIPCTEEGSLNASSNGSPALKANTSAETGARAKLFIEIPWCGLSIRSQQSLESLSLSMPCRPHPCEAPCLFACGDQSDVGPSPERLSYGKLTSRGLWPGLSEGVTSAPIAVQCRLPACLQALGHRKLTQRGAEKQESQYVATYSQKIK